jgi:hypothetical protein
VVNRGEDLIEELRQGRQAGDPRITSEGRVILRRLTTGDLADTFSVAMAESSNLDPMVAGTAIDEPHELPSDQSLPGGER